MSNPASTDSTPSSSQHDHDTSQSSHSHIVSTSASIADRRIDPTAATPSQIQQGSLGIGAPPASSASPRLRHTSVSNARSSSTSGGLRSTGIGTAANSLNGLVDNNSMRSSGSILLPSTPSTMMTSVGDDGFRMPGTAMRGGAGGVTSSSLATARAPPLPLVPSVYRSESGQSEVGGGIYSEGEMSDTYEGYYAERERDKASRGTTSRSNNKNRGALERRTASVVALGTRSGSLASNRRPAPSRGASRARLTTSRYVSSEEDDEEEGREERREARGRQRAMSPVLLASMKNGGDEEDDEVERIDRGEELVRKRMKDRARLKKEAERAKRFGTARPQTVHTDRHASYAPPTNSSDLLSTDVFDRSVSNPDTIAFPRRSTITDIRSRDVSRSRPSISSAASHLGAPSIGGYFNMALEEGADASGTERTFSVPGSPPPFGETLYSPSIAMNRASQRTASIRENIEAEEEHPDRTYDAAEVERSGGEEAESGQEVYNNEEEEEEEDDEDEDEDEDVDAREVEYTLKDRQDAINIEHPFGLPIWKPALYKKSRSVTRNAETALHSVPSSTVLRHLAPGNILWTLFFGSWLALVCVIVSAVLWIVPWGGYKYGRVVWELAGYLFWPFGKYVEGWSDALRDGEEEVNSNDNIVEADEEEDSEEDEEMNEERQERYRDVEDAGKTFGRGRSRQASDRSAARRSTLHPDGLVDRIWSGTILERAGSQGEEHDDDGTTTPTANRSLHGGSSPVGGIERTPLLATTNPTQGGMNGYGTSPKERNPLSSSSESTIGAPDRHGFPLHDFNKDDNGDRSFRVRALGRIMYWVGFYLIVAPLMLLVCILCWGMVFTIPMAKLLWVLLRHLSNEPLSLHFRSPPKYSPTSTTPTATSDTTDNKPVDGIQFPLRAGQRAPRVSKKSVADAKAQGRLFGPRSTVLLCTYRAAGLQYYKYTVDGVNIMFINLLSLVFFVIADDWFISPYVAKHHIVGGFLGMVAGKGFIFVIALLSVIPLSYFIGMAVASISAQSSIGMGAVINASFGSIIEIILYCIALTQGKADLVEGSIVGSLLAGVLLMPGMSMIGGAMRRKEQRFNAKSAGVTSTMLIMAIIGILTPTLFYEIYGSFQLTCSGCDPSQPGGTTSSCKTCYYEHISPVDDPFYKNSVRPLSYYCATILVLSYLVGLWFSLRTHASQIWQNAQPAHESVGRPLTQHEHTRSSLYKKIVPPTQPGYKRASSVAATPRGHSVIGHPRTGSATPLAPQGLNLPPGMTAEEFSRAVEGVAATNSALRSTSTARPPHIARQISTHAREMSAANKEADEDEAGGHDAPNWSRVKSASVLMGCTVLYAIIAEILVDVVDVVLDGSGIPEKFLGVTLFALVPNTTEFMNAISFAINGNIALSMEIGSAYALQVCLIQAPVMLLFTAIYSVGQDSMAHKGFTLVFPRWDVIAIILSIFLLTYTYIEARANYYRGTILVLSYLVLLGGFGFAPGDRDTEDNPLFKLTSVVVPSALSGFASLQAVFLSLFTH